MHSMPDGGFDLQLPAEKLKGKKKELILCKRTYVSEKYLDQFNAMYTSQKKVSVESVVQT